MPFATTLVSPITKVSLRCFYISSVIVLLQGKDVIPALVILTPRGKPGARTHFFLICRCRCVVELKKKGVDGERVEGVDMLIQDREGREGERERNVVWMQLPNINSQYSKSRLLWSMPIGLVPRIPMSGIVL